MILPLVNFFCGTILKSGVTFVIENVRPHGAIKKRAQTETWQRRKVDEELNPRQRRFAFDLEMHFFLSFLNACWLDYVDSQSSWSRLWAGGLSN